MAKTFRPLPARLHARHIGRIVKIREEIRPAIIRRCHNPDHGGYIAAGGYRIEKPDQVFYQPGMICHLSDDGRRALVEWRNAAGQPALWLDVEHIENA